MKELEYRFMIPLKASVDSGLMLQRARAQAEMLDKVVGRLVESGQDEDLVTAAKLMTRIDIFVEDRKYQANKDKGREVYPVDDHKRFGSYDAYSEVQTLVAKKRG